MGGPGSGPRKGEGHSRGQNKSARLALEISGGKYKNLHKALEYKAGLLKKK